MKFKDIAQRIIGLKDADLKLRDQLIQSGALSNGYNAEMEQLHIRNAEALNGIIHKIGYPTIDKVGAAASAAAWLVIQHSIGSPDFMRRCCRLLEDAVREGQASPINLAYLTDRIASFEGRPQLYGTQFDWDIHGNLSPNPMDDLAKVNERRKAIGLNTLEEQTAIIRARSQKENEMPPVDFEKRKAGYDAWRKRVGWSQ